TNIGFSYQRASAVALQSDGKIVAVGTTWDGSGSQWGHFSLVRYNADGSLDLTFGGGDGIVVTQNLGTGWVTANTVAIQADGKIIAAGYSYGFWLFSAMVRLNPSGSLDGAFGGGGVMFTDIGSGADVPHSVVLQSDGKVVTAGSSNNGSNEDFAIVRYKANGS